MEPNIKTMSVNDLKVMVYDFSEQLNLLQQNIRIINDEISKRRSQPSAVTPDSKDKKSTQV